VRRVAGVAQGDIHLRFNWRISHPPSFCVAGVALWALCGALGRCCSSGRRGTLPGSMKVDHPVGKGEATCHSSSWYNFMHGRLVDNNQLVVEDLCSGLAVWTRYL